ncbi:MAG: insulinase family protein [Bacteroidetes bacterium]|nr:insulinase family protein [Bacteroidota bacterium]
MQLNRTMAPEFREVGKISLLQPKELRLSNGIPLFLINAGDQEVVRIDFIFNAGTRFQSRTLVAGTASEMLEEGTKTKNAETIAEELDFFGAFTETELNQDTASFTLFTLNKHLSSTLPLAEDILVNASYPNEEFLIYSSNKRQQFVVDSEKVATLSRRKFNGLLFGEDHPYGRAAKLEDFDSLHENDIISFHEKFYSLKNCTIVVSGKIPDHLQQQLEMCFGKYSNGEVHNNSLPALAKLQQRIHTVEKEGAMQSSIRMGRSLFNKKHADYQKMLVLNTVLGGYFGSRLMANIREDKGYTYGIGSGIISLQEAGYFVISTEVGVDVTEAALKEIYVEIEKLQNDNIPESELDLVRNYMTGVFLRSTDGPFALADRFKGLMGYGLGYDYFSSYLETIRSVSANEIRDLAQKYLKKEDLIELVAGKRK